MPAFALKNYQAAAVDTLSAFLRDAALKGAGAAFRTMTGCAYLDEPFGAVPCVSLRIPTGGGKTLLASHAIPAMARQWRATDAPVAVWLVPSEAIRAQTLGALETPGHPFRAALEEAYGQRLQVCDLDRAATLGPSDWGRHAIVVVATIQSFRVEQTESRNVYAFSEAFERHFESLTPTRLAVLDQVPDAVVRVGDATDSESPLRPYVGRPRWSLANWLALQEPLIIVDEAHNARTENSFVALKRLNPAAILELTATPIPHRTNVIYHVSAQELQAESMVKLPIMLREHPDGWQSAVLGAYQTRNGLEADAQRAQAQGDAYVRPIALFQAQNANADVPVAVLRQHLIDELHVPEEQIAVATGDANDLAGVDLNDLACPIRYVITVQALREGWDCPFAYVLCSLQSLSSATAVEQLLGRVLRMPYAVRRRRESLNRAYAHVCEATFAQAANALVDRLVTGMGFEALDVASMIAPSMPLFEDDDEVQSEPTERPVVTNVRVSRDAGLRNITGVSVSAPPDGKGIEVTLTGHIGDAAERVLMDSERSEAKREKLRQIISQHNAVVAAKIAPSNRSVRFTHVPRLGYRTDRQHELFPLERAAVLESFNLDLLAQPVTLPGFRVIESDNSFEIYLDEARRVKVREADPGQLVLDVTSSGIREEDLVRWLDREVAQPDIVQTHLRAYLTAVVKHLLHEQRVPLNILARMRFVLARQITAAIDDIREAAVRGRFGQLVLDGGWTIEPDWKHPFCFLPGRYPAPAGSRYQGRWDFRKHYYPVIADLKASGEEFDCARAIDRHPNVRHWVRNPDNEFGFWLPTSRGRFFPDFVLEHVDGRLVVIEYKGAHLRTDPYEIEKRQVGELWAARSAGRCVFRFVYLEDGGTSMSQQLDYCLQGAGL